MSRYVKYALFQWEPKSIRQPLKQHGGLQNVWFPLRCHLFVYLPFRQEMDLSPHPTAGGFLADNLVDTKFNQRCSKVCAVFRLRPQGKFHMLRTGFLSPLTSWLFLYGHLKLQSSSVNRSPYVSFLEGRKVYGTGSAILWHSGIDMFKRRIVAIRQPPRSLGITTL